MSKKPMTFWRRVSRIIDAIAILFCYGLGLMLIVRGLFVSGVWEWAMTSGAGLGSVACAQIEQNKWMRGQAVSTRTTAMR